MPNRPNRRPNRTAYRSLPDGLTTTRDLTHAGWTESARRHAVRVGDLKRARRGVLAPPETADPSAHPRQVLAVATLRAAQAAVLLCPRAVISHQAAAIAHELPVYGRIERPCLTVPAGTALRSLARVHLHRATLLDADVTEVGGIRVTSPARTVLDVAREHGVAAGVVAADAALHLGLVDEQSLGAALSPLESLSRLRIAAARLPAPQPQAGICDEHGQFLGRCDFYWDEFGVVGESDGDLKYERGQADVVKERRREKRLTEANLIIVRWGWDDLSGFDAVARRLQTAFTRGARPGSPLRN